MNLIDFIY